VTRESNKWHSKFIPPTQEWLQNNQYQGEKNKATMRNLNKDEKWYR